MSAALPQAVLNPGEHRDQPDDREHDSDRHHPPYGQAWVLRRRFRQGMAAEDVIEAADRLVDAQPLFRLAGNAVARSLHPERLLIGIGAFTISWRTITPSIIA